MKVIKTLKLTESTTLDLCGNQMGDTVVGEVYFTTNSAVPFSVQATVDSENYQNIKLVNMANYTLIESASNAGIFMVPTAGYAKVKVNITGTGEVFVKENY